jgi:hypothetical protein
MEPPAADSRVDLVRGKTGLQELASTYYAVLARGE